MNCVWAILPGRVRCTRCGREIERLDGGIPHAQCGAGLGDMVAAGLSAVGITKERAQAVASAVGVKDCGCDKRQARLNELGTRLGLPPGSTG